ncbi:putative RNA recognition motif domain, nucleotide-binding alpha-beta plait domain superfamily [Helianthus annuus]|nr:putative RNA recognition motif domain, nucleotide-binding alpha-beta plait domain superfamily [Helianthus annuus]
MMNDRGGEQDNGGPWHDVKYRKNKRGKGDGIEWTFLVQNISNKVSKNVLWRAFKPFGFISDVYVARKRDSKGRCFGFVRYVGVVNMQETLAAMNTVKMFDMKVSVSLAKYDKDHKKFNYAPETLGRSVWRPKEWQQQDKNQDDGNNIGSRPPMDNHMSKPGPSDNSFTQEGRSFADTLKGKSVGNGNGAKVVTVGGKGSLYPLHCIGRSVLGLAKKVMKICEMKQAIDDAGLHEVGLSYVGGVTYILTFRDKTTAIGCMELHEDFFNSVFSKFQLWNGEDVPYSRLVNLSINGVPFIIRDNNLFDDIGNMFGDVVQKSAFSWQEEDNSGGSVMVVTSIPSKIDEAVILKWNNKTVVVWVSESTGLWVPDIDVSSLLGSHDTESEMSSDSDEVLVDMEELEEGEIGQNLGEDDRRRDVELEHGRPESSPVVNDRLSEDYRTREVQGSSPINVDGNTKSLHGNLFEETKGGSNDDVQADNLRTPNNIQIGGTNNENSVTKVVGPNVVVDDGGPSLPPNLGKRNREDRSPPSIGSTQGPTQRMFYQPTNPIIEPIDLNSPLQEKSDIFEACNNGHMDNSGASDTPIEVTVTQVLDSGMAAETRQSENEPQQVLTDEVAATIKVGSLIGVDLNGFVPASRTVSC